MSGQNDDDPYTTLLVAVASLREVVDFADGPLDVVANLVNGRVEIWLDRAGASQAVANLQLTPAVALHLSRLLTRAARRLS